jgi:hypothetical protein
MDNTQQAGGMMSVLEVAARVVSLVSLVGTIVVATFFLPTGGLDVSTAMFTCFILLLQLVGLVLGVGVPVLVQGLRLRFPLSRGAAITFAVAIAGVVAEGFALVLIPMTGKC